MPSLFQDFQIVEQVGVAIASDVEKFASGTPVTIPPIPLSQNANGKTELFLSLQRVQTETPFSVGSLTSTLGSIFLELLSNAPIMLPTFTERIGNTIISISASIQRTSTAAPVPVPAAT